MFREFVENRELATFIVDNEIDAEAFCETILSLAKNDKISENALVDLLGDQIVLEAWFGIPGAARVASGLGGLAAAPANWAGKKMAQGASAAKNWAAQKAQQAGDWMSQKAQQAGQAVNQAAGAVKNTYNQAAGAVKDTYNQAARGQAIKQVEDRIAGLYDAMGALGYDRNAVNQMLTPLQQTLMQVKNPAPAGGGAGI